MRWIVATRPVHTIVATTLILLAGSILTWPQVNAVRNEDTAIEGPAGDSLGVSVIISPHYSRVTELLVVQAFSSVMTQMDAGVMTIEAMRRPVG